MQSYIWLDKIVDNIIKKDLDCPYNCAFLYTGQWYMYIVLDPYSYFRSESTQSDEYYVHVSESQGYDLNEFRNNG